jgi:hypothetical protein
LRISRDAARLIIGARSPEPSCLNKAALSSFVQPSSQRHIVDLIRLAVTGWASRLSPRWWRRTRSSTWGRRAGPCLSSVAVDSSGEVLGSDVAAPPAPLSRCRPLSALDESDAESRRVILRMRGAGCRPPWRGRLAWPPATRQAAAVKLDGAATPKCERGSKQ